MTISERASITNRAVQSQAEKEHLRNNVRLYGLIVLGYISIIIFLWLPFGFKSPDNWDGWMFFAKFDQGNFMLFNPIFLTRPLTPLPWIVAYLISPNSFLGHNIILAGLLFAKGMLTYGIVSRLLRGQLAVAFMAGVLSIVYPADTGVFFLSALNIHLSLVLFLLAFYLVILYCENRRLWYFIASLFALVGVMAVYEAAFPLIFVVPLVLTWYVGRLSRRLIVLSSTWYGVATAGFIFNLLVVSSQSSGYQHSLLETRNLPLRLSTGIRYVYQQHFIQGFTDALDVSSRALQGQLPIFYLVLAVGCAIITGLIATQLQLFNPIRKVSFKVIGMMSAIGFIVILLGNLMYMPTGLLGSNWRTFFYASWGASIAVACGIGLLGYISGKFKVKWPGLLFSVTFCFFGIVDQLNFLLVSIGVIGILLTLLPRSQFVVVVLSLFVTLGMIFSLNQHNDYDRFGKGQLGELKSIVRQVPSAKSGTLFLLMDEGGQVDNAPNPMSDYPEHFIYNYIFDSAVKVVYQDSSLQGRLCHQSFKLSENEACVFTEQGVTVTYRANVWDTEDQKESYPYSQIIVLLLTPDGNITMQNQIPSQYLNGIKNVDYEPSALIIQNDVPRPRTLILLGE